VKKYFSRIPSDIFPPGVCELSVSYKRKTAWREKVSTSLDAANIARTLLYPDGSIEYSERFYIMMCDRSNKIYAYKLVSEGGLAGTVADPKLIFQAALLCHASSIVLIHNHPSGNEKPSDADITLTKKLCECGKLLEIEILDHIILTVESHYSFAEEGII
jgi:DNA repair protein RadC